MSQILKSTIEYRDGTGRGELLTMADGSIWFHPFSGCAPVCERKSNKERRLVEDS